MRANFVFVLIWFAILFTVMAFFNPPVWIGLTIYGLGGWYGNFMANKIEAVYTACKISLNKWARK